MLSHQLSGSSKFVSPVQTSERANNNAKIFGMTKSKFMEAIKPAELASRSMAPVLKRRYARSGKMTYAAVGAIRGIGLSMSRRPCIRNIIELPM
jgi:hypothetical protein